ncbi:DMT family transporter [Bacillus sp. UNC322MFChir4.1]|uniref:DMT family transporter n=1 Tax=Bacillus sp. UNC322MFChir4.1 TaxID=1449045 RepID=UPI00068C854B|nr:DMT family transporter [Bacillus sp. UNC322MFChir4.1]
MKRWGIELLLLCVVIIWGVNYTIGKYGLVELTAIQFTAIRMVTAAPLVLLSGWQIVQLPFAIEHSSTWFSLLYSIFLVTVFGLVMWYVGIQKIGASHTMVYMYITPFVAVLFAAIWAREQLSLQQLIGGFVIFIGLWFVKSEKQLLVKENISK